MSEAFFLSIPKTLPPNYFHLCKQDLKLQKLPHKPLDVSLNSTLNKPMFLYPADVYLFITLSSNSNLLIIEQEELESLR